MSRLEKAGHVLANLFLLAAGILCLVGLQGCASLYERAQLRYMKTDVDTVFTTVKATVPADTIVRVFKTDTTRYVEKIKQGRATVTIIREPTNTTVIAQCDSASTTRNVATEIKKQIWGVASEYKDKAQRWQTIALVLIGLFLLGVLLLVGLFFGFRFVNRNYSITPKNGTAA